MLVTRQSLWQCYLFVKLNFMMSILRNMLMIFNALIRLLLSVWSIFLQMVFTPSISRSSRSEYPIVSEVGFGRRPLSHVLAKTPVCVDVGIKDKR